MPPLRRRSLVPLFVVLLALVATAACASRDRAPTAPIPTPVPPDEPVTPPPGLDYATLGAALYPSRYVEGGTQLRDGHYTDFAKLLEVELLREPIAHADLDGDGDLDAAVLVASHTGGSATFYDLVVVENVDGEAQAVDSVHLGDRLEVTGLELGAGRVDVELLAHGPDDAMCCPTQNAKRAWAVESGELVPLERRGG